MQLKGKKGPEQFRVDEHPRADASRESLAKLPTVFDKGSDAVVTAGSSSGICDGAGALVLATEAALGRDAALTPLARVVGWAVAGVDPSVMGLGPAPAIKLALARAGLRLSQIDRVEVNEAFAAQVLAVEAAAGLDRARLNADGGAIALGHPLGASGARILGHLAHAMAAAGERYAIGSACIGGGQGIAVILENVNAAGAGK
jgi:acetyl-CoA acetyltransferase family protein